MPANVPLVVSVELLFTEKIVDAFWLQEPGAPLACAVLVAAHTQVAIRNLEVSEQMFFTGIREGNGL